VLCAIGQLVEGAIQTGWRPNAT